MPLNLLDKAIQVKNTHVVSIELKFNNGRNPIHICYQDRWVDDFTLEEIFLGCIIFSQGSWGFAKGILRVKKRPEKDIKFLEQAMKIKKLSSNTMILLMLPIGDQNVMATSPQHLPIFYNILVF